MSIFFRRFCYIRASQLLDVEVQHIEKYVMDLAMEKKVVLKESDEGFVFIPPIIIIWNSRLQRCCMI